MLSGTFRVIEGVSNFIRSGMSLNKNADNELLVVNRFQVIILLPGKNGSINVHDNWKVLYASSIDEAMEIGRNECKRALGKYQSLNNMSYIVLALCKRCQGKGVNKVSGHVCSKCSGECVLNTVAKEWVNRDR